jgi:hypothetical protein
VVRVNLVGSKLYYHNGLYIGEVETDVDGYYKFWPSRKREGYWDQGSLLELSQFLEKMNASWDKEIAEYFEKENNDKTPSNS